MMLRVLGAVLLAGAFGFGQSPLEVAEGAYRAGDYEKARQTWEMWLEDHDDGRVDYNLGNCEYRLGDHARALWRYERARRRLGDREELLFNRSLAIRRLGRIEVGEKGFVDGVRVRLRTWAALDWVKLALPLELLGLVFLGLSLRRRTLPWVAAALLLLGGGVFGFVKALGVPPDRVLGVLVLEDRTPVRAEPREDLEAVVTLGAGVRAEFVAASADWVKVRLRDREGWIPRSRVGLW